MHKHSDVMHRSPRRATPAPGLTLRQKALPLCLSMALATSVLLAAPARAGMAGGMAVPGANTGTVSVTALTSPTGGTVVGGVGSISQNGNTTVINQISNKLALDWLTFNVGKDATVQFNQPSFTAVALNRILDQNPSQIFGRINSNGQVFLINTHGIIFGSTAQVNVGGLMASTLDLTPTDFLANHFNLDAHGGSAGVVNHGTIAAASGGSVSLVGGSVANDGLILANYGNINLDGADKAVLDFDGNGLINIQVTGELKQRLDANAAVRNSGTLQADGGTVVLQASAAKDLFTDVVNNSGVITAGGINTDGGTVRLVAAGGNATSSGSINVSGVHGGNIQLLSDKDVLVTGGSLDASGSLGGGSVLVGGDEHGANPLVQNAARTYLAGDAVIKADALQHGDGGKVVVWSNGITRSDGTVSARGGAVAGNGGFVEVSGKHTLNFNSGVDTSAPNGATGMLLLDPDQITITHGASSGTTATVSGTGPFSDDGTGVLTDGTLNAQLGTSNVTVTTSTDGITSNGDVVVNLNSNTLTLDSNTYIALGGQFTGPGSLDLNFKTTLDLSASAPIFVGTPTVTATGDGTSTIVASGQTWNLTGANQGDVVGLGVDFTGVANLSDSTQGNFVFADGAGVSGAISGGSNGTLDYSAYTTAVNVGLGGAATGTGGWSGVGTVLGGSASDTISGSNQTYSLTGANAGSSGGVSWTSFEQVADSGTGTLQSTGGQTYTLTAGDAGTVATLLPGGFSGIGNIDDSAGTVVFDTGGSVSGNVTASILDYSSHTGAVTFDLSNGTATGIGGTWGGVTSVTGSGNSDIIAGSNQTYTLSGPNAGSSGGVIWTSFEQIADSGTGTLQSTSGQTYTLTGSNTGTVATLLPGGFSGIGNIDDSAGTVDFGTGGSVSGSITASTLDYSSHTGAVTFDLSTGTATGIGGSWSGVTSVTGSGNSDTIAGSNRTYALSGANAGGSGGVSWTSFEQIADSGTGTLQSTGGQTFTLTGSDTGTVATLLPGGFSGIGNIDDSAGTVVFDTGGNVSGNITASTLDYSSHPGAVTFDLFTGTATGIGGSWSGVTSVTGSGNSDTIAGSNQTYTLSGANAGSSGGVSWTSFEQIADSGTGTLQSTGGQTYTLTGSDTGTVATLLPGGFSGIGNIDDSAGTVVFDTGGSVSGNITAQTLNYGSYVGAVNFNLSNSAGTTTGIGGTWSDVTSVTGNGSSATIAGSNQTYTLDNTTADKGSSGGIGWTGFGNITDSAGTILFGTGGSVSGNITAATLDYSSHTGAVTFDLSNGGNATTGIGGSWSGVTSVTGSGNSDTIAGTNQTYTLTGSNAGNNGTVSWTSFENLQDAGSGTLKAASQTWSLTGHNQGTLTNLSGAFAGMGNLVDTGTGHVVMHSGADGDVSGNLDAGTGGSIDYTGYTTPVDVNLSGSGTTGVGGTVSGIASITASSNLGVSGTTAGSLDITTTGAGTTTTLGTLSVGTDLGIVASGAVLQAGALTVTGATTVNAGSNAITLIDPGNDFGGAVTLTGGTTQIADQNALTLGTLSTGALTVTSHGALDLGHGGVGGNLIATSNNGAITEATGGVQVSGTSNLQAGTGAITLLDGSNHFAGAVTAAGQGVQLQDIGDLTIAALSSGTNGTVNLTAGGALNLPASGIDTGTANLTLAANGGSLAMPGALSGANVTLIGRDGISLGNNLSSAGTVTLTSTNGAISQSGGVITAGTLTGSSADATTLGNANLITALGSFSAAGLSLTNAQALTINGPVDGGSSTAITSSGNLVLAGNVSGTTTSLDAGGTISQSGGIVAATTLTLGSVGGSSLTKNNQIANLGAVTNTGSGGLDLTNATALNLTGALDVGTASGNDVNLQVTGSLTQSGGSVITADRLGGSSTGDTTLGGSNQLNHLGGFSAANLSLTNAAALTVDGPLVVPGTLSLTTTAGALSLATDLTATTVNLNSASALTLANNIDATTLSLTSGGSITQGGGALTVSGTTTVNAGSNAITLIDAGNDFTGAVNLTGGTTQIADQNALILGTLSTGALTVTSHGALDLGHGGVGGNLIATSNNGAITESTGGVQVTGTSNLQAGTGAITLLDGSNHFAGAVTAAGQGVQLQDVGDLTIAALSSGTNGTVNLTAGGALNLPASGIDTGTADLTLAANGGSLAMPGALSGANVTLIGRDGISLGNNLSSAGTVTLTSSNGAISQSGGVITAGTLTGSSHANTTLNQANLVGQLGNFTAANFSLVNAQALAVTGVLSTVGGSGAISLTTTSGALDVQQALSGGAITLDSAGSLALATNITGSAVTLTSDGNISQSGGVIQAGTLTGSAAGSANLTKANKIGTLGNFSAANGLTLSNAQALTVSGTVNGGSSTQLTTTAGTLTAGGTVKGDAIALAGQGGVTINGTVNAGAGDIALTSAGGAITEGSAGALIGGGLSGTSAGAMSLGGANQIVTLGNITTGGDFSFRDTRTLTVNSPLAINGGNGNLSLTTTGSTSDLILATDLTGRTVALAAGRDITQAGSAIHATTLTGSAGRDAHFTGANHIGALGDFTAASLTLVNAQALNVTGSVSTGSGALSLATTSGKLTLAGHVSGGATTLDAAGDMALNGALSASSLALQSGGAIAEGSSGVISANSLTGSATGATALNGANHVGTLGSFNADGFQFTNAGALAVSGPIDGGSSTRLATTAGDLAVNGRVSGTSTELVSAGAITQGSGGKVVAATLTGQSAGATTLTGANSIDALGSFRAAGLSLSNGKTLVVSGPVDGGASAVLTTTAGDLSVEGALSASAVRLVSAGAIGESGNGAITATTLGGQAKGATSLGTSSAPVANHIGTLGNFSSPAGFSLTNAQTLTLASVDGSSFTIDAGHAALYLGVTGGDLLQSGTTPLYDGAGTFFSSGKMGTAKDPIYVIGDSGQVIADVGAPPAYFYALDRQGNILPLTGDLSFNVPTSLFFGKAQNGNGRGDAYIDPSVISANYRSFGIVPSGILLPEDQQQCQPELEDCSSE